MRTTRWERGAGRIGTIIGLIILVAVAYALIVFVPTKVNVAEFRDFLQEKATYLASDQEDLERRAPEVMQDIQKKWKDMGWSKKELTEEQLKIERGTSSAKIRWKMDIPIKTIFGEFKYKVDDVVEAPFI